MGGLLFATGPNALLVPRLSNDLYCQLKAELHGILGQYFEKVVTPIESPGKTDHGDVDIMVARSKTDSDLEALLTEQLKAARTNVSGPTTSFAIPHPSETNHYVQVDIHVCSIASLDWEFYMHSYGDLTQIIGVLIRALGFTANDEGFNVRIPEMEETNRKESLVYLTNSPQAMLEFLGLDVAAYEEGFPVEQAMFTWVLKGDFFSQQLLMDHRTKSNDRQRVRKRAQYRRFIEDFCPTNADVGRKETAERWKRSAALQRAVARFGAEASYCRKLQIHETQQQEAQLWERIQAQIPEEDSKKRNLVMRGIKRWVEVNRTGLRLRITPNMSDDAGSEFALRSRLLKEDTITEWVRGNWQSVQGKEKSRVRTERNERAAKRLRADQGDHSSD